MGSLCEKKTAEKFISYNKYPNFEKYAQKPHRELSICSTVKKTSVRDEAILRC